MGVHSISSRCAALLLPLAPSLTGLASSQRRVPQGDAGEPPFLLLRVVDPSGRALPGVRVLVDHDPYGSLRAQPPVEVPLSGASLATTDAAGELRIECGDTVHAAALLFAESRSARCVRLWGTGFVDDTVVSEPLAPLEVVLPRGVRIEGRVHDAPHGARVRAVVSGGALLDVGRARDDHWLPPDDYAFTAPVDTDGAFVLDGLPSSRSMRLELVTDTSLVSCLPACVRLRPGEVRRIDWALGEAVEVTCVVRDERGKAVERARVAIALPDCGCFAPWSSLRSGRTDADGRVVFEGVPPGRWRFELDGPGPLRRRSTALDWPAAHWSIDLGPGLASTVALTAYDIRRITGVVVGPDGVPMAGEVSLTRIEDGVPASESTSSACDSEGRFASQPLPPGTYRIRASTRYPADPDLGGSEPRDVAPGHEPVQLALRAGRAAVLTAVVAGTHDPVPAWFCVASLDRPQGTRVASSAPQRATVRGLPTGEWLAFARTQDGRVGVLRFRCEADRSRPLTLEVPVAEGAALTLSAPESAPTIRCELFVQGAHVEDFELSPGESLRLRLPDGPVAVRWSAAADGHEQGLADRHTRELVLGVGNDQSLVLWP